MYKHNTNTIRATHFSQTPEQAINRRPSASIPPVYRDPVEQTGGTTLHPHHSPDVTVGGRTMHFCTKLIFLVHPAAADISRIDFRKLRQFFDLFFPALYHVDSMTWAFFFYTGLEDVSHTV